LSTCSRFRKSYKENFLNFTGSFSLQNFPAQKEKFGEELFEGFKAQLRGKKSLFASLSSMWREII
jgi:hypothetical protein